MSVSSHLAVEPREYDARIRQLIPLCDELIPEVARALAQACLQESRPQGFAQDLDVWFSHLARTFEGRAGAKRVYESWADKDLYVPLATELKLLQRAGFDTDVPWRKSPFAVIVAIKRSRA